MYLYGERVILRAVEEKDNNILRKLINDPEIERMLGGKSFPISEVDQLNWYKNNRKKNDELRYMIEYNFETVGTVILSSIDYINGNAEVHIKLLSDFKSIGIGTESLQVVLEYSFKELRLICVYAKVVEYNLASRKTFLKLGFKEEGNLRKRVFKKGEYHDIIVFSYIKDGA